MATEDPAEGRHPVRTFNASLARPLSAALANLGFTPGLVHVLGLVTSLVGLWLAATSPRWTWVVGGALLVHLGLLLHHAAGQVAEQRGVEGPWVVHVGGVVDRVVEVGLVAALLLAGPLQEAPAWLPAGVLALGPQALPLVAVLTVGAMLLWRFLGAQNDVLYLRTHLLQKRALPDLAMRPQHVRRRALVWVDRDGVRLVWLVGVVLGQFHATLALLLVTHAALCVERTVAFSARHPEPEGEAARILDRDYQ